MPDDLFAPESRADQIFTRFCTFHAANFTIWLLFEKFTKQLIAAGREHYSVDAIMHRIRWHVDVETAGESVKLNDHYTAYYARMFMAVYPQHTGFFELRRRLSTERPAYETDIAVFHSGPVGDESTLMQQLRLMALKPPKP